MNQDVGPIARIDFRHRLPAQSVLMSVYAGLPVYGYFRWRPLP